ncbi:hypothetical protein HNR50_002386 [Spirochaeta isovalerica]|uniref:Uncharacterized protein n=1 Tax=Spirochaeta isovalerica TaxID=150 RepID=A0A841R9Z4_9SPIO|nr:hypothetical protein [Spirochaeta isovalerica]
MPFTDCLQIEMKPLSMELRESGWEVKYLT